MRILMIFLCCIFLLSASVEAANEEIITSSGEYIMGDSDSRDLAQKKAVEEAMHNAVLQAGVYIASYSKANNFTLTEDEIVMISSGVIKVQEQVISFETPSADKWICHAIITAAVNTDSLPKLIDAYINSKQNNNNYPALNAPTTNIPTYNDNIPPLPNTHTDNYTPMPHFPQYQPDTITQTLRGNRNTATQIPPPLAAMPIAQIQKIYANSNTSIAEAADNDIQAYNIYRITSNPQQDYTYVIYDKTGQNLMSLYLVCWNDLLPNRLRNMKNILYLDNMEPISQSRQHSRKLYKGHTVNIRTDYMTYKSHNDDYKIAVKIEYWQEEGFTTVQIRRSNSMYI